MGNYAPVTVIPTCHRNFPELLKEWMTEKAINTIVTSFRPKTSPTHLLLQKRQISKDIKATWGLHLESIKAMIQNQGR